jgi:hypothetical protein
MGRNNSDFEEGKDHILSWTGDSGDSYQQEFPTSELNPDVDKQKAVGKYLASSSVEKPAKGSKVKWKAKDKD